MTNTDPGGMDLAIEARGFRVETHLHTYPASACANDGPHDMVAAAWLAGADAVCITDHETLAGWNLLSAAPLAWGCVLVPGIECTVRGICGAAGDIVVLADSPEVLEGLDTRGMGLRGGIAALAAALAPFPRERYFATWVHPCGPLDAGAMDILSFVDAIEAVNGNQGITSANAPLIAEEARSLGLVLAGGSDAHSVTQVARAVTVLDGSATDAGAVISLLRNAPASVECTPPAMPVPGRGWNPRIRFE